MSFFRKLLALFSRPKKPAGLTVADVRKARLQLEQIQQRIDRSAEGVRGQREELFAAGQAAASEAEKLSAARKVRELDSLLAGWEQELADVARRRQVLVEAELALAKQAMTSGTELELKSLADLDRFIEDVAVEREVQAAKAARILGKVEAVKDLAAGSAATSTDAETAGLVRAMSARARRSVAEKKAPAREAPAAEAPGRPPVGAPSQPAAEAPAPAREPQRATQPPRELVEEEEDTE